LFDISLNIANAPKGQFNSAQGSTLGKRIWLFNSPTRLPSAGVWGVFWECPIYLGRCPGLNYFRLSACGLILIPICHLQFIILAINKLYLSETFGSNIKFLL